MKLIYFWVTSSKAWGNYLAYHQNFFIDHNGFLMGFIGALIFGVICAVVFYLGFCNSKTSSKYATLSVWMVFLVIGAVIAYFYADYVVIGEPKAKNNESVFRTYSFYKANDTYYNEMTQKKDIDSMTLNSYRKNLADLKANLDKGSGDVRLEFDLTTAILAAISYFVASMIVKRFTISGKVIPLEKP
ncbi:MAG: hypothetical protein LUC91_05780 [Prevotella sp.]|nr:hypothetical protein [Prevotella sp.]